MVLCVKTSKEKGRQIRGFLKINKLYEDSYLLYLDNNEIYLPIREIDEKLREELQKKYSHINFVEMNLKENNRTRSFRRELEKVLPKNIYPKVSRAYEQIGTIAVIEIFPLAEKYEQEIAKALLNTNKGVKTILKKGSLYEGKERLHKLIHLVGEETTETTHFENGVYLKVDVEKTYFSARTVNERKRVSSSVNINDDVLVMFSGVAPYPCVISKNSNCKKIVGIEYNRTAHEYALENVKLNNLENVELYYGDIREIVPELKYKFDKIIMPSPSEADYFLDEAFQVGKDDLEIFLYLFSKENKLNNVSERFLEIGKKYNYKILSINFNKQQKIKEGVYKYCIEIKAKKLL